MTDNNHSTLRNKSFWNEKPTPLTSHAKFLLLYASLFITFACSSGPQVKFTGIATDTGVPDEKVEICYTRRLQLLRDTHTWGKNIADRFEAKAGDSRFARNFFGCRNAEFVSEDQDFDLLVLYAHEAIHFLSSFGTMLLEIEETGNAATLPSRYEYYLAGTDSFHSIPANKSCPNAKDLEAELAVLEPATIYKGYLSESVSIIELFDEWNAYALGLFMVSQQRNTTGCVENEPFISGNAAMEMQVFVSRFLEALADKDRECWDQVVGDSEFQPLIEDFLTQIETALRAAEPYSCLFITDLRQWIEPQFEESTQYLQDFLD